MIRLRDDIIKPDRLVGRGNILHETVRRSDGSTFCSKVPNATMTNQSLEIARRCLEPLDYGVDYNDTLHENIPRRLDDDIRFSKDGVDADTTRGRYVFGVMLGTDGGTDNMVYQVVPHAPGFDLTKVVPWRYVTVAEETSHTTADETKDLYYKDYTLRNEVIFDGETYGAYYAKRLAFDIKVEDIDSGLPVSGHTDDTVSDSGTVNVVGKTGFDILKDELIEFFNVTENNPNGRKFSSFIFLSGTPVEYTLNGHTYREYRNVIASHKINVRNIYMDRNEVREYTYEQTY